MRDQFIQLALFTPKGKTCSRCRKMLPRDRFWKNSAAKDGLQSTCKSCQIESKKAWTRANPERAVEHYRSYRKRHPDRVREQRRRYAAANRAKVNALRREWARRNPERVREIERRKRNKNRERINAYRAEYNRRNPEKVAEWTKRAHHNYKTRDPERYRALVRNNVKIRKHRRRANGGSLSRKDWMAILDRYGHRCLACGATDNLTIDHVVPLIKGGANDADNVQPLCMRCNRAKWFQTIDYRPVGSQH